MNFLKFSVEASFSGEEVEVVELLNNNFVAFTSPPGGGRLLESAYIDL